MTTKEKQEQLDPFINQLQETGYCSVMGLTVWDTRFICESLGLEEKEVRLIPGPQLSTK